MEYKFYRVETGNFIDRVKNAVLNNEVANTEMIKFKNEVCASDVFRYNSGEIAYFTFKKSPSLELWKKAGHGFMPRRGNKDGKLLSETLRSLPHAIDMQECLDVFKLTNVMVLGEATSRGIRMHSAHFCGKHDKGIFFIKVPQEKESPYQPTSNYLVECKEWEMMKFMEE